MKNNKNKKNYAIVFIALISVSLILICLLKSDYKILKFGNNVGNKSLKEVEEYILNISSYSAEIEVLVQSNKTNNKYIINQEYNNQKASKQEIVEPSIIKGVTIVHDGNNLQISNSQIQLNTMYQEYEYIVDNALWLNTFTNEYAQASDKNIKEENNEIIMEVRVNKNKYMMYKKLYIDKQTYNPTKLVIQDENQKNTVYIKYTKIKINDTSKEEVLAFKLKSMFTEDL